jgi:hypothetical protein
MLGGELARVERPRDHLALPDPDLDAAANQARVERVVVAVDAHVRIGRHARHQAPVDVGQPLGQRPQQRQLLRQPIDRAAAEGAVEAQVGALVEPAVELLLVVELVREAAAGLEARLRVPLQPLDHALRLRIAALEETPADAELAAEGRERLGRMTAAGMQRAFPVPDERLRQPAQLADHAADPVEQVRRLLRKDQRAGACARVRQTPHNDEAAARLASGDRDLPRRLPEIELTEHARPIRGALKGTRPRQKQRPNLAQIVIEDRLPAHIALLLQKLAQSLPRQARVRSQKPVDLLTERIKLRRPRRPPIPRRLRRAQRPPDRVAAVAGTPRDLLDRQPPHEIRAADLRPLLHPDHNLLLARTASTERGLRPDRTAPHPPPAGQLSTGVRGSVLNRRRYWPFRVGARDRGWSLAEGGRGRLQRFPGDASLVASLAGGKRAGPADVFLPVRSAESAQAFAAAVAA